MKLNKFASKFVNPITVLCFLSSLTPFEHAIAADGRVYSGDRSKFAFVKESKKMVNTGAGDVPASEIWLGDSKSGKTEPLFKFGTKVATGQALGDLEIGGASNLTFSADGQKLYFLCGAFAVSDAVIEDDLKTKKLRYVCDGNTINLITKGKWKGNLAVARHKYHDEGGAYNWEWVISPSGKELGLWRKNDD